MAERVKSSEATHIFIGQIDLVKSSAVDPDDPDSTVCENLRENIRVRIKPFENTCLQVLKVWIVDHFLLRKYVQEVLAYFV